MKLKNKYFNWIKGGKCSCGSDIEFIQVDDCGILVNCETKGRVNIPNLWIMSKCCSNPLCEWSKIRKEVEAQNSTNPDKAWRILNEITP